MGSSISPILAKIFIYDFENRILEGNLFGSMIKRWVRYVDDILIIWSDLLLKETNATHNGIKFTMEKGNKIFNHFQPYRPETNSEQ